MNDRQKQTYRKFVNIFIESPEGREIWQLLQKKFDRDPVIEKENGNIDPLQVMYREGSVAVIRYIKKILESRLD